MGSIPQIALATRDDDTVHLGTIGGADYYEARLILKRQDGETQIAGRAADWPLISRDAEIAALKAEIEALKAKLHAQPKTMQTTLARSAPAPQAERHACHECGKTFKTQHGLNIHRSTQHKQAIERPRAAVVPIEVPPIARADLVDPSWHCDRCGRSQQVIARSIKDPALCIGCVESAPALNGNGHQVAA